MLYDPRNHQKTFLSLSHSIFIEQTQHDFWVLPIEPVSIENNLGHYCVIDRQ